MATTKEHVAEILERSGLAKRAAAQALGRELVVEGDCAGLNALQKLLEAEGIDSTLELAEEEASWVTHGTGRSASNCVMVYSLRIPVN